MGLKALNKRSWQGQGPDTGLCLRFGDDPMPAAVSRSSSPTARASWLWSISAKSFRALVEMMSISQATVSSTERSATFVMISICPESSGITLLLCCVLPTHTHRRMSISQLWPRVSPFASPRSRSCRAELRGSSHYHLRVLLPCSAIKRRAHAAKTMRARSPHLVARSHLSSATSHSQYSMVGCHPENLSQAVGGP